jgi:hypothetical protein
VVRKRGEVLKRWNEIKERKQQNRRRRLNEYQRHGEGGDALTTPLSTFFFVKFSSSSSSIKWSSTAQTTIGTGCSETHCTLVTYNGWV